MICLHLCDVFACYYCFTNYFGDYQNHELYKRSLLLLLFMVLLLLVVVMLIVDVGCGGGDWSGGGRVENMCCE